MTVALAFVKELDLITSKRQELAGQGPPTTFHRSGTLREAKGKRKEEGKRSRKECRRGRPSRGRRGVGEFCGGSSSPEHAAVPSQGGPEPNPLRDSLDFQTWAVCFPRWFLKCRFDFFLALAPLLSFFHATALKAVYHCVPPAPAYDSCRCVWWISQAVKAEACEALQDPFSAGDRVLFEFCLPWSLSHFDKTWKRAFACSGRST